MVMPLDPWDNEYQYEYPPTNNRRDFPDIWSLGPDGEADTEDDVVNWRQGSGEGGEEGDMEDGGSFESDLPPSDTGGGVFE
jgi:hypothetical protein